MTQDPQEKSHLSPKGAVSRDRFRINRDQPLMCDAIAGKELDFAAQEDDRSPMVVAMGMTALSGGIVGLLAGGHVTGALSIFLAAIFGAFVGWTARGL